MPGTAAFDVEFWTDRLWQLEKRELLVESGWLHRSSRQHRQAVSDARYMVATMLRDHQAAMQPAQ